MFSSDETRTPYWVIRDGKPVNVDFPTWLREADSGKMIASTELNGATINTFFVGIEHHVMSQQEPRIYETIVRGGYLDGFNIRSTTQHIAEQNHEMMVDRVRNLPAGVHDGAVVE